MTVYETQNLPTSISGKKKIWLSKIGCKMAILQPISSLRRNTYKSIDYFHSVEIAEIYFHHYFTKISWNQAHLVLSIYQVRVKLFISKVSLFISKEMVISQHLYMAALNFDFCCRSLKNFIFLSWILEEIGKNKRNISFITSWGTNNCRSRSSTGVFTAWCTWRSARSSTMSEKKKCK